jgi:hypothetical protein
MVAIRSLKAVCALAIMGLLLTGCGNGVGTSPSTSTTSGTSVPTSPTTPSSPSAPASPAAGSATLSWSVPTENTNGTPLTDLAGYHIYYGTTKGIWTSTITVLDASETSHVVSGLSPGTYYFTVTAFNSEGMDSPDSNIGSKTI